ncbi:hypothetical protein CRUP_019042 [Coryphaenoides rupestris]|nr:hypothetical protein CRUP_019042 [Coryphaenoides rupestris]
MRKPRCLKSDRSRYLFTVCQALSFSGVAAGAGAGVRAGVSSSSSLRGRGGASGRMRAPATIHTVQYKPAHVTKPRLGINVNRRPDRSDRFNAQEK